MDVKQLNKIIKLYYFHTLKALRYGQGKIKMYYGMSRVKKWVSGKRSIAATLEFEIDAPSSIIFFENTHEDILIATFLLPAY